MENILMAVLGGWCLFYCGLHALMFHQAYGWDLNQWWRTFSGFWGNKKSSDWIHVSRLWVLSTTVHVVALILLTIMFLRRFLCTVQF